MAGRNVPAAFKAEFEALDVKSRYELRGMLGEGSYGMVATALDRKKDEMVAIKRMDPQVFVEDRASDNLSARRALREIRVLAHYRNQPHIVGLRDILPPPSEAFTSLFLVMDQMEASLHAVLKANPGITTTHVKVIMTQIFLALDVLHSTGAMHRDLSTKNVLINGDCLVKICDMGLAREVAADHKPVADLKRTLTFQVTTLWWRAPEVLLQGKYSAAVDVWAAACILGQMLRPPIPNCGTTSDRRGLFKGRDEVEMLDFITHLLGTPTTEELVDLADDDWRRAVTDFFSNRKGLDFSEVFVCPEGEKLDPSAVDLLAQLLRYDAKRRITARGALQHPYLSEISGTFLPPVYPPPLQLGDEVHDLPTIRRTILATIGTLRPQLRSPDHSPPLPPAEPPDTLPPPPEPIFAVSEGVSSGTASADVSDVPMVANSPTMSSTDAMAAPAAVPDSPVTPPVNRRSSRMLQEYLLRKSSELSLSTAGCGRSTALLSRKEPDL
eukprot:RCo031175